jgi:hypothetical protein
VLALREHVKDLELRAASAEAERDVLRRQLERQPPHAGGSDTSQRLAAVSQKMTAVGAVMDGMSAQIRTLQEDKRQANIARARMLLGVLDGSFTRDKAAAELATLRPGGGGRGGSPS